MCHIFTSSGAPVTCCHVTIALCSWMDSTSSGLYLPSQSCDFLAPLRTPVYKYGHYQLRTPHPQSLRNCRVSQRLLRWLLYKASTFGWYLMVGYTVPYILKQGLKNAAGGQCQYLQMGMGSSSSCCQQDLTTFDTTELSMLVLGSTCSQVVFRSSVASVRARISHWTLAKALLLWRAMNLCVMQNP